MSIFDPWRRAANRLCKDWVDTHSGKVMTIYDLPPIFAQSLLEGATEKNIIAGFDAPGLWKLNRFKFSDTDFMPSRPTDRPYTPGDIVSEDSIPIGNDIELGIDDDDENGWIDLRPTGASTPVNLPQDDSALEDSMPLTSTSANSTSTPATAMGGLMNVLQEIRPLQQAPARQDGRKRKTQKSTIITSDVILEEVQEQNEKEKQMLLLNEKQLC